MSVRPSLFTFIMSKHKLVWITILPMKIISVHALEKTTDIDTLKNTKEMNIDCVVNDQKN